MKRSALKIGLSLVVAALAVAPASAHTGVNGVGGFATGFAHPFGGIDHLMAMIAVGLIAAMMKGRALWALPATFVAFMALGAVAGALALGLPLVEAGIALSVVVFGLLLATGARLSVGAAVAVVAAFAIFHGHAHGTEMPAMAAADYGAGFLMATALLHAAGVGIAVGATRLLASGAEPALRLAGALTAVAGVILLAA